VLRYTLLCIVVDTICIVIVVAFVVVGINCCYVVYLFDVITFVV
jgi:hypothetical protein